MPNATDEEISAMRVQARTNPSAVLCPGCGSLMKVLHSVADRYVMPFYLLEEAFKGLPAGSEWRVLSLDLWCENCFPSAVAVAL